LIPKIDRFFAEFLNREILGTDHRFAAVVALKLALYMTKGLSLHTQKIFLAYPKDFRCIPKASLGAGRSVAHMYDGKFDSCLSSIFMP